MHLVGTGTLIHQHAKSVISVKRTLGAPINISSINTVQIGQSNPPIGVASEISTKISISSSLSGIKQGDLYHISSQDLYPFCIQMTIRKELQYKYRKQGLFLYRVLEWMRHLLLTEGCFPRMILL